MTGKLKILTGIAASVLLTCMFIAPATAGANSLSLAYSWHTPHNHWPVSPSWPSGPGGYGGSPTARTTLASDDQATGLVLIDTTISYGYATASGTGMVIGQDGVIVTNHHVVAGSTSVTVTVPAGGAKYDAQVLGYDPAADVAVLKIDTLGLPTVTTNTADVTVGETVTTVGNAQGAGNLVASTGSVTNTGQDITVTNDDGTTSNLSDLVEFDANLVPGDSGGAVLDSAGEVVAMNVPGSTASRVAQNYGIPIATVLDIADDILAGSTGDGSITLGRTAALGIQVSTTANNILILGVVVSGPAAQAGVTPGSVLTAMDGSPLASVADLTDALHRHQPGDTVTITWTDQAGTPHTATTTLTQAGLA